MKGVLTPRVFLLILMVDVLNTLAELSFKLGAMAPGIHPITVANLSRFALGLLSSAGIWLGTLGYLVMVFLWITVLSKIDLSVAIPLQSTDYLLVPLASLWVLHERISALRWVGIVLIIVGVYLVSRSAAATRTPRA